MFARIAYLLSRPLYPEFWIAIGYAIACAALSVALAAMFCVAVAVSLIPAIPVVAIIYVWLRVIFG